MFWLGLVLPVCFVPGYTGAYIPTQWAILWAVLPLSLWRGHFDFLHALWVIFIGYAMASLMWTNVSSSIYGIGIAVVWALSFHLGSTLKSLEPVWKGLAIGMCVSSMVAVAQYLGYQPVRSAGGFPGLLYNTTASGAVAALILIGLYTHRLWPYMAGPLASLVLCHSRGAWLVLGLVLICRHWAIMLAALILAGIAFFIHQGPSDVARLQIWQAAWMNLSWFGNGPFYDFHFTGGRPEFVHNDYLQLWYEYGLGCLPILCILAVALCQTDEVEWPVLVAVACFSFFYFPLWCPLPAFIGFLAAGRVTRSRDLVRGDYYFGGPDQVSGRPQIGPYSDRPGVPDVSVEFRF